MENASFEDDNPYADLPKRAMRVKVLYSFDTDNKTNCLARFPNTLQIPAVAIDESSQVGVIELRQCIQAILAASPEMIPRLSDGDFAIYAFDYSEFETPLVGQGMLSAAMAGNDKDKTMITGRVCKNVPAIFSNGIKETLEVKLRLVPVPKTSQVAIAPVMEAMRSGSPAMSGGFDPNAWNVSLHQQRPQTLPHDYFSLATDTSNDSGEMTLGNDVFDLETAISGSQQMLESAGTTQTPTGLHFGINPAFATNPQSASGSRTGSPVSGLETSNFNEHLRHQSFSGYPSSFMDYSRPASRTSVRSEASTSHKHQRHASAQPIASPPAQEQTELYYHDDGLPRKRAKVVQTDWHGRTSFGSRSSDLRITAAAANSVHMHRPIPKRATAPGSDLEPPPRVPTPVPQRNHFLQQQRLQGLGPRQSMLRQASTADSDLMSDFDHYSDGLMSSPEEESPNRSTTAGGTPQDIPSSPPVFPGINQPQPSSPGLPSLPPPRLIDSGYMSEQAWLNSNVMDSLEDRDDCGLYACDREAVTHTTSQRRTAPSHSLIKTEERASVSPPVLPRESNPNEIEFHMVMPGDETQLPRKMRLSLPPRRSGSLGPKATKQSSVAVSAKAVMEIATTTLQASSPGLTSQIAETNSGERAPRPGYLPSRRSSLALPTNLSSQSNVPPVSTKALHASSTRAESQNPEQPRRKPLKRSRTQAESEAGSPAPSDNESRPRGPKRSGSGATRRMVIQDRLEQSLASGEAPQFCAHCGAIETPTWRRLYVKYVNGKPSPLDEAEGEGETIGVEATETDGETGEVVRFVIRKSLKRDKNSRLPKPGEDFEDTTLCNPCGLWFNKTRTMRPSDRWGKKPNSRKSKKSRLGESVGMSTDGIEPQSEAFFTDAIESSESYDDIPGDEISSSNTDDDGKKPAPIERLRATSLQPEQQGHDGGNDKWNASRLDAALSRQVQSSPLRFGSKASPIEIDELTPKPTRRLLFPSPRKDGEVKSLDDNGQSSLNATPPQGKAGAQSSTSSSKLSLSAVNTDVNVFEAFTCDKENMGLHLDHFDALAGLFEGSPSSMFKTPRKTPSKNTTPDSRNRIDNLLKTPTPASRKRKPLSTDKNASNIGPTSLANAAAAAMNDFMTSPSSSRYFLRSTPSRAGRTPGRSNNSGHDLVSPFSRQLAEMLSDSNEPLAPYTSPSRGSGGPFDFSDLPTFTTPGRQMDWTGIDEMLQSSEFAAFDDHCGGSDGSDVGTNGGAGK
nr:hypothetical protein CFP56_03124 [Quercus suber]